MSHWNFWRFWSKKPAQKQWSNEAETFLELAVRSGLVHDDELNEACTDFASDRMSGRALDEVCVYLVSKGALTRWQCDKLRSGKWKGFFLDGYRLLGQMSKDLTTSTYLCAETSTGKRVAMAVTPPWFTPDGKISYNVRELADEASSGET